MDTNKQPGVENIFGAQSYPLLPPVIHEDDLASLHLMQSESYNPATSYFIESTCGRLTSVKVYSALGFHAGITGIGFLYDGVTEHLWGTSDKAASLSFFLGKGEHIISILAYTIDSAVCHLQVRSPLPIFLFQLIIVRSQFTTNFHKTSDVFPELAPDPNKVFECIKYSSLHGGHIKGVCGCFRVWNISPSTYLNNLRSL
jgi:hypothetical protein